MSTYIQLEPATYSAGYSALPIMVYSDEALNEDVFNYIVNVTYNKSTVTSIASIVSEDELYTRLTFNAFHKYKKGDIIMWDDSTNGDSYTGYYTVVDNETAYSVLIDLVMTVPFGASTSSVYNVIKYKLAKNENDKVNLDIHNTVKDFVTKNLEDSNEIFSGADTVFEYKLIIGEEIDYSFDFFDNTSDLGQVAFWNPSITSLVGIPFQIGDEVIVQQDLASWLYYDNASAAGQYLSFVSSSGDHNYEVGQQVIVTGQSTNPQYNGVTTVRSGTNTSTLVVNKHFDANSPVEGGRVVGTPRPEYNVVCYITDIRLDPTLGVVITTNTPYRGDTEPISGKIKFINTLLTDINKTDTEDKYIYNAKIKNSEYNVNAFDKYVIQSRAENLNNISTVLGNDEYYRIEKSTKSWLLAHNENDDYTDSATFRFYDALGVLISTSRINNVTSNVRDLYVPVGIDQLLASANFSLVSGTDLSIIVNDVVTYDVAMGFGVDMRTNHIKFQLNTDCSRYDLLHLMWKDELGSWLSYPFKYISTDSTEFERKTFYKKEGTFDDAYQTFKFDSFGRGETSYFGRSRDKVNLNSGWIEDFENVLIKDLLGSTDVYIQQPDGTLKGCIVENKTFVFKNTNENDLYQYKIGVRLSSNEVRF